MKVGNRAYNQINNSPKQGRFKYNDNNANTLVNYNEYKLKKSRCLANSNYFNVELVNTRRDNYKSYLKRKLKRTMEVEKLDNVISPYFNIAFMPNSNMFTTNNVNNINNNTNNYNINNK